MQPYFLISTFFQQGHFSLKTLLFLFFDRMTASVARILFKLISCSSQCKKSFLQGQKPFTENPLTAQEVLDNANGTISATT